MQPIDPATPVNSHEADLPLRGNVELPPADEQSRICELYQHLLSVRKVVAATKRPRTIVQMVLKKFGLYGTPRLRSEPKIRKETNRSAQQRAWREAQSAKGLCTYCNSPHADDSVLCIKHRNAQRTRQSARRTNRCNVCGKPPAPGRAWCADCFEKEREKQKRMATERKAAGLCRGCGRLPHILNRVLCETCVRTRKEHRTARTEARRQAGLCIDCGNVAAMPTRPECLDCYFQNRSRHAFGNSLEGPALREMWEACGGRCAYTGLPLTLGVDAEIDHKQPATRGGLNEIGNLQWVHATVNQMKWKCTEAEFLQMVRLIYEHRGLSPDSTER